MKTPPFQVHDAKGDELLKIQKANCFRVRLKINAVCEDLICFRG